MVKQHATHIISRSIFKVQSYLIFFSLRYLLIHFFFFFSNSGYPDYIVTEIVKLSLEPLPLELGTRVEAHITCFVILCIYVTLLAPVLVHSIFLHICAH